MAITIIFTVLSTTIGLYQIHNQEQKHISINTKTTINWNSKLKCPCQHTYCETHCCLGIWTCLLCIISIIALIPSSIEWEYYVVYYGSIIGLGIYYCLVLKLWFTKQYCTFWAYSYNWCPNCVQVKKISVTTPNYCYSNNNNNNHHFHYNVDCHPNLSPFYLYVGKKSQQTVNEVNHNQLQVTQHIFWKLKQSKHSSKCFLYVRFAFIFISQLSFWVLFFIHTSWDHDVWMVLMPFFIFLIDALLVSRLARLTFLLAGLSYVCVILYVTPVLFDCLPCQGCHTGNFRTMITLISN